VAAVGRRVDPAIEVDSGQWEAVHVEQAAIPTNRGRRRDDLLLD